MTDRLDSDPWTYDPDGDRWSRPVGDGTIDLDFYEDEIQDWPPLVALRAQVAAVTAERDRLASGEAGGGGVSATCPHGMPTPSSCIDCMDEGLLPPPPRDDERVDADAPVIPANFESQCSVCGFPIGFRHFIKRTTKGRWIHVGCDL